MRDTSLAKLELSLAATGNIPRDIHLDRACELFGKSPKDITSEERRLAKLDNFAKYIPERNSFMINFIQSHFVLFIPVVAIVGSFLVGKSQ